MDETESEVPEIDLIKDFHDFKDNIRLEMLDFRQDLHFIRESRRETELTLGALNQSILTIRKEIDKALRQIDDNNEYFTSFARQMTKISASFDEISSDLRLKASQKELSTLEGRFSFMCPMTTAQKLEYAVQEKASEIALLELKQDLEEFKSTSFREFSLKKDLQDSVHNLNFRTLEALKPYAKEVDCANRFKQCDANLHSQIKSVNLEIAQLSSQIESLKLQISQINSDLSTKSTISDLETLSNRLQNYSQISDFSKLRKEMTIFSRKIDNRIEDFQVTINGQDQILARYDEVLLDKASKLDLKDVNNKIRSISKHIDFEVKVEEMDNLLKKTAEMGVELERKLGSLEKGVNEALGVTRNVKSERKDIMYLKEKVSNHAELLSQKPDKVDFIQLNERKANLDELKSTIHSIDVLHRMIKVTSVLLNHTLKGIYKSQVGEVMSKEWVLKHAEMVVNWANDFSPLVQEGRGEESLAPVSPIGSTAMSGYAMVESPKFGGRRGKTKAIKLPSIDTSF